MLMLQARDKPPETRLAPKNWANSVLGSYFGNTKPGGRHQHLRGVEVLRVLRGGRRRHGLGALQRLGGLQLVRGE